MACPHCAGHFTLAEPTPPPIQALPARAARRPKPGWKTYRWLATGGLILAVFGFGIFRHHTSITVLDSPGRAAVKRWLEENESDPKTIEVIAWGSERPATDYELDMSVLYPDEPSWFRTHKIRDQGTAVPLKYRSESVFGARWCRTLFSWSTGTRWRTFT